MCRGEQWWCIGCKKARPGLRTCEKYHHATESCEDMNLENPPLKPVFDENCDNFECPYLDPALAWHPGRPLSPDSQAFALWLKGVTDKMDDPSIAALEATNAEPGAMSPQMQAQVDVVDGRGSNTTPGLKPVSGDTSVESRPRASAVVTGSPSLIDNTKFNCSNKSANEPLKAEQSQILARTPGVVDASSEWCKIRPRPRIGNDERIETGPQLAVVMQTQPSPSHADYPKPISAAVSPLASSCSFTGTSTSAEVETLKAVESPKSLVFPFLPTPTSINVPPSNGSSQIRPQRSVMDYGDQMARRLSQQKQSTLHTDSMNGRLRPSAEATPIRVQQKWVAPATSMQTIAPSGGSRRVMNPGYQAVMDKLTNFNAGVPSRNSPSPSITRWQQAHHHHHHQSQEHDGTLPEYRGAPATRDHQDSSRVTHGITSEHVAYTQALENEVRQLRAQHYRPTCYSGPNTLGAMNNMVLMGYHPNSAQVMDPQLGCINNNQHSQDVFSSYNYVGHPQNPGSLNTAGMYHGSVQQVPPNFFDPRSSPLPHVGSQLMSLNPGYTYHQARMPSLPQAALPRLNASSLKRSHSIFSNDGLLLEPYSTFSVPFPMNQQSNYPPTTYQRGQTKQVIKEEPATKRVRVQMEQGKPKTARLNLNKSNVCADVQDMVSAYENGKATTTVAQTAVAQARTAFSHMTPSDKQITTQAPYPHHIPSQEPPGQHHSAQQTSSVIAQRNQAAGSVDFNNFDNQTTANHQSTFNAVTLADGNLSNMENWDSFEYLFQDAGLYQPDLA